MGALTGGDRLEKHLAEIARRVAEKIELRAGFLEGATYPDGTPVAQVAAWQEFGTATIPSRPFFRTAIAQHEKAWGELAGRALVAMDYDVGRALAVVGQQIVSDLVASIEAMNDPPLSPITVMLRGMRYNAGKRGFTPTFPGLS